MENRLIKPVIHEKAIYPTAMLIVCYKHTVQHGQRKVMSRSPELTDRMDKLARFRKLIPEKIHCGAVIKDKPAFNPSFEKFGIHHLIYYGEGIKYGVLTYYDHHRYTLTKFQ